MTAKLTPEKCDKIAQLCKSLRNKSNPSVLDIAKVVGTMISYIPCVELGKLHYRNLERCKNVALALAKGDFKALCPLSHSALLDILWWENNVSSQCSALVKPSQLTLSVQTAVNCIGEPLPLLVPLLKVVGAQMNNINP